MVHAIQLLKCEKGHVLPITFDSNECGCHHDGKPCIMIMCSECFKEHMEKWKKDNNIIDQHPEKITIPLDKEGEEIVRKLLGGQRK